MKNQTTMIYVQVPHVQKQQQKSLQFLSILQTVSITILINRAKTILNSGDQYFDPKACR